MVFAAFLSFVFNVMLPAEMRKCFVSFSHLMYVFSFLYCGTLITTGSDNFLSEPFFHSVLGSCTSGVNDPLDCQTLFASWFDFHWYLIRSATNSPWSNLQHWFHIVESFLEDGETVFLCQCFNLAERSIKHFLRPASLAIPQKVVNEFTYHNTIILRIGLYFSYLRSSSSAHMTSLCGWCFLWSLHAVE